MTYEEAVAYLHTLANFETGGNRDQAVAAARWDLGRMEALLARLGNPHRTARTVHIAGTKGKGSTAAMIAAALRSAGHHTGLYTSPHLHSFRERIRVDADDIPPARVGLLLPSVRDAVEAVHAEGEWGTLTWFEVMTALAFCHFAAEGVDVQVLEVGLGGRLDATNIVTPDVAIITPISLDHTGILGTTHAAIAREKAGIIKPGIPVVTAPQPEEALAVIAEIAAERGSELIQVGWDIRWERVGSDREGQTLMVWGRDGGYHLRIPLLGAHQAENAAVAVGALEVLDEAGVSVSPEHMMVGLSGVRWPGRLETVAERPLVVLDGAHNVASAARLRQSMRDSYQYRKLVLVMGTSADKDLTGMAAELAPIADSVVVTQAASPRSAPLDALEAAFAVHGHEARPATTVAQALRLARQLAGPDDLILVTGSLFVVAEARGEQLGISPE
ncbi:MAG: bifunctional folylpolyglutamate synthase/dihydrofolate synthase [Chloroflexi bacterium]|nr:bifunctional folylpolyglutamate synthase/dihydrofolate synthase [Chloroflexota bacterium]